MINELDGFRLKFKEQWWCVSAFTDLDREKLTDEIKKLSDYVETQIRALKESNIYPRFVPDANDRQNIAFDLKIIQNLIFSMSDQITFNKLF